MFRDPARQSRFTRPRRLPLLALASVLGLALWAPSASAQGVQLAAFGGQNFNTPFHVASPPGDPSRVFVVEGAGRIRLVKDGVTQPTAFLDISGDVWDNTGGEGGCECGMFSMAFAPDYTSSGLFYVFFTRDVPGASAGVAPFHNLVIREFRRSANPDLADPATGRDVIVIPHLTASNHNGGQLQFGPDKLLYIWVGDGGNTPNEAQSLSTRLGKILRIDPRGAGPLQYSIPSDNPFADGGGPNADEIYAHGLRNPYRGSFDRSTGDLIFGDVGGGQVEEIDYKPEAAGRGANFGWPCFEGTLVGTGCPVPNHSPPIHQYPNGGAGAAVNGGFVIRDSALPQLAGRYVYADTFNALGGQIRTLDPAIGTPSDAPLGLTAANVVSFGQDACGHIYVARIAGPVLQLQPVSGPFPCKLAPELTIKKKGARKAAKKGAIVIKASCDEDCDFSAEGLIKIKGKKKKLRAGGVSARLQLGEEMKVRLELSKRKIRRLRKALRKGARAFARIEASATGGGGGTDTERLKIKQKRKKKKRAR